MRFYKLNELGDKYKDFTDNYYVDKEGNILSKVGNLKVLSWSSPRGYEQIQLQTKAKKRKVIMRTTLIEDVTLYEEIIG